jgi:hypothetical protein
MYNSSTISSSFNGVNAFSTPDVFQVVVKIGESTYLFGAASEMLAITFDNVENDARILRVAWFSVR